MHTERTQQQTPGRDASVREQINLSELGRDVDGQTVTCDRRLFMQLFVWSGCTNTQSLIADLEGANVQGVLYGDANDHRGVALLTFSENPTYFIGDARGFLNTSRFSELTPKPEYTMFGRTYSLGYEADLETTLITRPQQRVCDSANHWAIWYPLRRAGSFEQLPHKQQWEILMEHGRVGREFGQAGYVHDVRLACHGLDRNDNDFVIGLIGPNLHPLSFIVQEMRKTRQTSLHLECLGPFFVGRVLWQSKPDGISAQPTA